VTYIHTYIHIYIYIYIYIYIIIRHELSLDRRVSASSNSLFRRLTSRFRPFRL